MDLKHKLKDLVMSEFAYDLSKYEDEGETKVNNITENLVKLFSLYIVGSSAWYCEISTINGQWFEIVTGVNETEVAIKIEKAFGKKTKFEIKNEFKLM